MIELGARQLEYRRLSKWVQRVILGLGSRGNDGDGHAVPSSAERGAGSARELEDATSDPREARALVGLRASLDDFDKAEGTHEAASRDAVVRAAGVLRDAAVDFAHPPLNVIWAAAGQRLPAFIDGLPPKPSVRAAKRAASDADRSAFLGRRAAWESRGERLARQMGEAFVTVRSGRKRP